ncbi:MAG: hypothetical protein ABWY00_17555 [Dongiaceae bacterium]
MQGKKAGGGLDKIGRCGLAVVALYCALTGPSGANQPGRALQIDTAEGISFHADDDAPLYGLSARVTADSDPRSYYGKPELNVVEPPKGLKRIRCEDLSGGGALLALAASMAAGGGGDCE